MTFGLSGEALTRSRADTPPTQSFGQGYYYVMAVTYLGERRYGRECVNGVLSGSDPAVLLTCGR